MGGAVGGAGEFSCLSLLLLLLLLLKLKLLLLFFILLLLLLKECCIWRCRRAVLGTAGVGVELNLYSDERVVSECNVDLL